MEFLIVIVLAVVIFFVYTYYRNREYMNWYMFMQKMTRLAKEQLTPEHSIAVLKGAKSENIENALYAFCITQDHLKIVVKKHNATLKDFESIYAGLIAFCSFDIGTHFIPVATFFFPATLDYALTHRITNLESADKVADDLINFFESMRKRSR